MAKAGGPSRNFRRGEKEIGFEVYAYLDSSLYKGRQADFAFCWSINVSASNSDGLVQVKSEFIRLFALAKGGAEDVLNIEVNRSPGGQLKTKFSIADQGHLTKRLFASGMWFSSSSPKREIFSKLSDDISGILGSLKKRPRDVSILESVSGVHSELRQFFNGITHLDEYNIQPDVARQAVDPLPIIRMGNDGAGVSEVIGALQSDQYQRLLFTPFYTSGSPYFSGRSYYDYSYLDRRRKNPIDQIIKNLRAGVPSVDSIGTEIDPSTGRRFVTFKSGQHVYRPQEVSDGTFKWLCILVALFVPTSRVILLEEPENFMHPWMQQRFIGLAREQARNGRRSVVISTHSVTVLNALNVEELRVVHQEDGETILDDVADVEGVRNVLANSSFGLGDIWVSGEIGGVTGGR